MIMKILYKADDGTIFNDEISCRHYEINSELNSSYGGKSITCYDKHNNIIKNPDFLSIELYETAERIYVGTEESVQYLTKIADLTGFICYADIYSPGFWSFNYDAETYIKES